MPAIERVGRTQTAAYWGFSRYDDDGDIIVSPATDIRVRWVNSRKLMQNAQGKEIAVDAQVVAGEELVEGSLMYLGGLADWNGTGSAGEESALMQVVAVEMTPDIKGRNTMWTVGLAWFRDEMPEVV